MKNLYAMLISFSIHEIVNRAHRNIVTLRQHWKRNLSEHAGFAYFLSLRIRQLCPWMQLAVTPWKSFFGYGIRNVFLMGSKKNVVWVHANWIIAFMTGKNSFGNLSVRKFPCNPLRICTAIFSTREISIPTVMHWTKPSPAVIFSSLFYPIPKFFRHWSFSCYPSSNSAWLRRVFSNGCFHPSHALELPNPCQQL